MIATGITKVFCISTGLNVFKLLVGEHTVIFPLLGTLGLVALTGIAHKIALHDFEGSTDTDLVSLVLLAAVLDLVHLLHLSNFSSIL